jgi:DNA topoisomerase I
MRAIDRLQQDGIRRVGSPKSGFRYVRPDGRALPRRELPRVRALRLPPAWTEVHVSPRPGAKLQAIGRDRAGRWQYRYHPDFARRRADAKYRRLLRFAAMLPRLRERVSRDLRRRGFPRERVLAAMVRILETCFMRPGSERYAREHHSYGLSTIRPRHVRVEGDRIVFEYRGKAGRKQLRELDDAAVARLVQGLLRVPGRDVFKFVDQDGEIVDVRRRHLNRYLREVTGGPFTAKDFRTWAGTLLCASELARAAAAPSLTARKKLVAAAVKAVAARLGNTPSVARASYVSPAVLAGFHEGDVLPCSYELHEIGASVTRGLHRVEEALVAFLRRRASPARALRVLEGGGQGRPRAARPAGAVSRPARPAARAAD